MRELIRRAHRIEHARRVLTRVQLGNALRCPERVRAPHWGNFVVAGSDVAADAAAPDSDLGTPLDAATTTTTSVGGFTLLIRRGGERWEARVTGPVAIFPCHGASDEASHAELLRLYRRRGAPTGLHTVQSLRRDQHGLDGKTLLFA